jgi:RNA polymerase subunit RPABC4/transcription elongation factor Spt4
MSPELINNIATLVGVIVAMIGAFLFAFWVAMGIWTFNDIRSRSRDWLAILLACVLVLVFPVVGLILYLMIRPKQTLAEVYDRALEEEALLRELEETLACQACGAPAKEAWVYCPNCHAQLQHSCPSCSKLVRNEWEICVFCGAQQAPVSTTQPATAMPRPVSVNPFFRGERPQPAPEPDENLAYRPARLAE